MREDQMSRVNPGAFPLLDLLGRRWRLPASATSAVLSRTGRALAAALADGRIALVATDDAEPPESRIAVDEFGRRTIAPRQGAPRPAIVLGAPGTGPALASAAAGGGFVVAWSDGALARISEEGGLTSLPPAREARALDARADAFLVILGARGVELRDASGRLRSGGGDLGAQSVAVSPDGARLAYGCGAALCLADSSAPLEIRQRFDCAGRVERIVWREDGAYLAAICGAAGVALLNLRADRFGVIGGFPTPPRSVAFSQAGNALIAAGAFRITAWDLARPPFDGERAGALETGRPGLAPVAEVAALPGRRLVAAAYANGRLVIAALGGRDEMILQAAGPQPVALAPSGDGRLLALAAGESVSLLSLPDALFK
jgi:hypothetical protein